jgi:anti-sigma regulatory factor (Ser/Thr protein kinase)
MEVMGTSYVVPVTFDDSSQVGQARRRAVHLASALGFDEIRLGELSIVVTEAARNIAAHAGEGYVVLSPWTIGARAGMDVFAIDRGKGIPDIDQACEDGFSTAGTAGQGLGAISRIAAELHIYSTPDVGSVLFARIPRESKEIEDESAGYRMSVVSVPMSGETACGDAWSAHHEPGRSIYLVADGLGHGPVAAEAANEAVRIFNEIPNRAPEFILREIHGALAKTRGAAVSVAEVLYRDGSLNYAGAGNISTVVHCGGKTRSVVSMNGTVGHTVAKFQQFSYPWERNSMLIMHSDGIATRWNLEQYSGLASRHPALIAAILYRDFTRGRDDATILVTRDKGQ